MNPWWLILLIVLGLLLGLYLYYYAFFKAEDDSEAVGVVVLASVSFGFALLGLIGIICG